MCKRSLILEARRAVVDLKIVQATYDRLLNRWACYEAETIQRKCGLKQEIEVLKKGLAIAVIELKEPGAARQAVVGWAVFGFSEFSPKPWKVWFNVLKRHPNLLTLSPDEVLECGARFPPWLTALRTAQNYHNRMMKTWPIDQAKFIRRRFRLKQEVWTLELALKWALIDLKDPCAARLAVLGWAVFGFQNLTPYPWKDWHDLLHRYPDLLTLSPDEMIERGTVFPVWVTVLRI